MPFSMQDLMASLPGSPGSQPQVAPTFNPQINTQQLAANVQTNQDAAKSAKNQKLSLMFYALSGALKGDKNFMQNTLALQAMQEGKKKEEERKKNYKEMIDNMDPNSPLYNLAKSVGYEGIDKVAQAQFDLETRVPKKKTATDYVADIMEKVKTPGYVMTEEDKRILQVSRKADPATMMIEDIQAEAIKSRLNQTGGPLQTFASTAAAIAAGLKPGDQYLGSDGNTYRL